MYTPVLIVK